MKFLNSKAKLLAVLILSSSPALADVAGEREYNVACAGCHGESAMGDGPLAGLLNIATPSLLSLTQGNDGSFPFEALLTTIDGRDGVRAVFITFNEPLNPAFYFDGRPDFGLDQGGATLADQSFGPEPDRHIGPLGGSKSFSHGRGLHGSHKSRV